MEGKPLLTQYPALRTREVDQVLAWLKPMFSVRNLDMPEAGRQFDCEINHCRLPTLSLIYARYGSPFVARMEQSDAFLQGVPVSGSGEVSWRRNVTAVAPRLGGIAAGPGTDATFRYDDGFAHLILRVSPGALTQRLALLLDRPVDPPLQLSGRTDPVRAAGQARLLRFVAEEMNRGPDRLPDPVVAELEDAILVSYLLTNEHNYSGMLNGRTRAVAPWQVRRAVDFMEEHWDESITIEKLTQITETSARSLFQLFKKTHDVSPMVYLSQVRLRHAREMLSSREPGTSVTKVGFLCGFSNMGHFAMKYYSVFGEKPSDTLRNNLK